MVKINENSFSTALNVVKKGTVATLCMVMMGLFLAVGCKKDNPTTSGGGIGGEEPTYPTDIPFTKYSLAETCQWKNLAYDNTVIVINSDEKLSQYVACTGDGYPEIDFSEQTLLLASGKTDHCIFVGIIAKMLQQLSTNLYEFEVELTLNVANVVEPWQVAIIVSDKLSDENTIDLKITTIEENSCRFQNPLTDLPWLKEIVEWSQEHLQGIDIYQCTYKDGIGFLIGDGWSCYDPAWTFRDCEGMVLCGGGGISGENHCLEYNIDYEHKKLIWDIDNGYINGVCEFDNPIEDLPWLKEQVKLLTEYFNSGNKRNFQIYQCTYLDTYFEDSQEETGFIVTPACTNCEDNTATLYRCTGRDLCHWEKVTEESCYEYKITSRTLIWEIK